MPKTLTGRGALAARWSTCSTTARQEFPHVAWERIPREAGRYIIFRRMEGDRLVDIAVECGVSRAAVTQEVKRLRLDLADTPVRNLTAYSEDRWSGSVLAFRNDDYCYWPEPAAHGSVAIEDWGQRRFNADRPSDPELHAVFLRYYGTIPNVAPDYLRTRFLRFVAAEEDGARRDVARGFHVPRAGRASLDSIMLPEVPWHITGSHGESGMWYEIEDRVTTEILKSAKKHAAAIEPLDAPTLNKVRRMVAAGASTVLVAARLGIPETQVRIMTGDRRHAG